MGLCSPQRLESLAQQAARPLPAGVFLEVGVYSGDSLRVLAEAAPARRVWGADTWAGLPRCHWSAAEFHDPGEFTYDFDSCRARLIDLPNVRLLRGVAPGSLWPLADMPIALVHLDVDLYLATHEVLAWLMGRMAAGGVVILDDWDWPRTPGVRRAAEELGLAAEPTVTHQALIRF